MTLPRFFIKHPLGIRGLVAFALVVLCLGTMPLTNASAADSVPVRAWDHDSFGRVVFDWPAKVAYAAKLEKGKLTLRFSRAMSEESFERVIELLPQYITAVKLDKNGKEAVFSLSGDIGYRAFNHDYAVVVDLFPRPPSQVQGQETPGKEDDPSSQKSAEEKPEAEPSGDKPVADTARAEKLKTYAKPIRKPSVARKKSSDLKPKVGVRVGRHAGFSRFVFDWTSPVKYKLDRKGNAATLTFDRSARVDLQKLRKNLPPFVKSVNSSSGKKGLSFRLTTPAGTKFRHFKSGPKVVLDVLRPAKGRALAANKPSLKPSVKSTTLPTSLTKPSQKAAASDDAKTDSSMQSAPRAAVSSEIIPEALSGDNGGTKEDADTSVAGQGEATEVSAATPSGPPRAIEAVTSGDLFSLRFNWPDGVAAAVYRRAGYIWMVFDYLETLNLDGLVEASNGSLLEISQIPDSRATILRVLARSGINPSIRKDANVWFVDLKSQAIAADVPVMIKAEPEAAEGARLFIPVTDVPDKLTIRDSVVGDKLTVLPVAGLGQGVNRTRDYAQFRLIGTAQGIVVEPLSDALEVKVVDDGVEITSPVGLYISSRIDEPTVTGLMSGIFDQEERFDYDPQFDMSQWGEGSSPWYNEARQSLINQISQASADERNLLRRQLAEYYFANQMYVDAATLLSVIAQEDPEMAASDDFAIFQGMSWLLSGRPEKAEEFLLTDHMGTLPEGVLWQAALAAEKQDWEGAAKGFSQTADLIPLYPRRIQAKLALLAAETAMKNGASEAVHRFVEILRENRPTAAQQNYGSYLVAQLLLQEGESEAGVALMEKIAKGRDRRSGAFARRALLEHALSEGEITDEDAINRIEQLRYAWRGGDFEFELLDELGKTYARIKDYQNSLLTLKLAATSFPKHEGARELTKRMGDTFVELFLDGAADELSPVTALAVFNEFRELTPAGERGDRMIQGLADRMVSVDLLGSAAELLEQQVKFRLKGEQKARVGTQLALIYLLDRKPLEAVNALKASEVAGISPALVTQRRHIEARSFVDRRRPQKALAILDGDNSLDAEKLRADIYWRSQKWLEASNSLAVMMEKIQIIEAQAAEAKAAEAARVAEALLDEPVEEEIQTIAEEGAEGDGALAQAEEKPLPETVSYISTIEKPSEALDPHMVLRWAVSSVLANNKAALQTLADKYSAFMDKTPYRDDFQVIINEPVGSAESIVSILDRVKEVSQYEAFMAGYLERLQTQGLSAIN